MKNTLEKNNGLNQEIDRGACGAAVAPIFISLFVVKGLLTGYYGVENSTAILFILVIGPFLVTFLLLSVSKKKLNQGHKILGTLGIFLNGSLLLAIILFSLFMIMATLSGA